MPTKLILEKILFICSGYFQNPFRTQMKRPATSVWTISVNHQSLFKNTECCNQTAHCKCFETWIHNSFIRTRNVQSSCAYCRSNYNDEKCFLCLKKVEQNEEYLESACCKTKLHANCITKLHQFYDTKEIKPYLECGHFGCNCLWIDI